MADFSVSVADLFNQAFGSTRGKPFDGNLVTKDEAVDIEFETVDDGSGEGTEFLTVRNELNAKTSKGQSIFMPIQIGGVLLPNEPTISFSKKKRIVETALVGSTRRGTVKELISSDDWEIVIRGVSVNHVSALYYPEDEVNALNELDAREEAMEINCALTQLLGIDRIVIKSFRLLEMVGVQHAQAYEFQCVSDDDFILNLD